MYSERCPNECRSFHPQRPLVGLEKSVVKYGTGSRAQSATIDSFDIRAPSSPAKTDGLGGTSPLCQSYYSLGTAVPTV